MSITKLIIIQVVQLNILIALTSIKMTLVVLIMSTMTFSMQL